jgi:hypothetical protein
MRLNESYSAGLVVDAPTVEQYAGEALPEVGARLAQVGGETMTRPDWAPAGVDLDRPNVARMYDYYLGGSHNFRVDREVADQVIGALPDLPRLAQANRAFLHRAVRYCLDMGIRQFLDIGSGIPTVGNVHEIAQRLDPTARVVGRHPQPLRGTPDARLHPADGGADGRTAAFRVR